MCVLIVSKRVAGRNRTLAGSRRIRYDDVRSTPPGSSRPIDEVPLVTSSRQRGAAGTIHGTSGGVCYRRFVQRFGSDVSAPEHRPTPSESA